MHAGFTVSSFFKNNNISTVFTLCGGHISPILVGCESEGIDIVEVRDEVSTVFGAVRFGVVRCGWLCVMQSDQIRKKNCVFACACVA